MGYGDSESVLSTLEPGKVCQLLLTAGDSYSCTTRIPQLPF